MRKIHLLAALTATTLMLGAAGVRADEPAKPADPKPADTKTAPATQAGKKLTDDELIKMIEDLGYEIVTRPKPEDQVKRVVIKVKRGNFDCPMSVNLSYGDQNLLQTFVSFGKLGDAELANAPALAKLLELNDVMGQCQFRINPNSKGLFLNRTVENRGVTAKVLRDLIEDTVQVAFDTQEAWDHSKWGKAAPKTETKTEPKTEQKASK